MSLSAVPARVRRLLYLFYAGAGVAAIGLVGFIVSFSQVGSAAQAAIDVHEDVPVLAYASIVAWLLGLGMMWYGRRHLDAAVREKMEQDRAAAFVERDTADAAESD